MPTDEKGTQIQSAQAIVDSDLFFTVQDMATTPITKVKSGALVKDFIGQPGFLFGLTLANNGTDATNDIDIAIGKCRDSTDAVNLVLASILTKRLDAAWTVGTNQGGLDTGAIGNNTYHIWLIKRSDTGVVDALFSLSTSVPTMPANYDFKRRIGAIVRSSGAILGFVQDHDDFVLKAPIAAAVMTNPGIGAVTKTINAPTGIRVKAHLAVVGFCTGGSSPGAIYISDLSVTDVAAGSTNFSISAYNASAVTFQNGATVFIYTNTSAQVRVRIQFSNADTQIYISTIGWTDARGRLD
jgi:hypothetical protein